MDKVAQKRRLRNKMREMINAPTEKLMGTFSPQFIELMDQLREVDDRIREHAGELKNFLKLAKTNFNRREYMTAIAYLGQFHEKMEAIYYELSKLATAVDVKHHEFLFSDIDPEHMKYLVNSLGPKLYKKPTPKQMPKAPIKSKASLHSVAGITDWWANLTTDRGRALAAWEKRFPKESKELKRQTESLLNKSEGLLSMLLETLKSLASFRSTRRLEEYLGVADKFKQKYVLYNSLFSSFYSNYVHKFVQLQQQALEQQEISPDTITNPGTLRIEPAPEVVPSPAGAIPLGGGSFLQPGEGVAGYIPNTPLPAPAVPNEPAKEKGRGWPSPYKNLAIEDVPERHRDAEAFRRERAEAKAKEQAVHNAAHIEMTPITEHDVGSTLRSPLPHLIQRAPQSERKTPSSLPAPKTMQEPEIELTDFPNEWEETTMVSPVSHLPHKDRPIAVSMAEPPTSPEPTHPTIKSHQEFLAHLTSLGETPFKMAIEIISYANSLKGQPEVSQQLLQLSKKMLAG